MLIELVKRSKPRGLIHENVSLEPIRKRLCELVGHVGSSGDSDLKTRKYESQIVQLEKGQHTDIIKFFEGALLGFWNPEEYHDAGEHIQTTNITYGENNGGI